MIGDYIALRSIELLSLRDGPVQRIDPRVKLLLTLLFSLFVVSFPSHEIGGLLPFFLYPSVLLIFGRIPLPFLLKRLLLLSPFVFMVALFNPLMDATGRGWTIFLSILIRFILTISSLILLVATTPLPSLSLAMEGIGLPRIFSSQIILLYRYIFLLVEETIRVLRAREVRAFGRPVKVGDLVNIMGSIFMRSLDRSERIYQAMVSRGFDGSFRVMGKRGLDITDILFFSVFLALFITFRWMG